MATQTHKTNTHKQTNKQTQSQHQNQSSADTTGVRRWHRKKYLRMQLPHGWYSMNSVSTWFFGLPTKPVHHCRLRQLFPTSAFEFIRMDPGSGLSEKTVSPRHSDLSCLLASLESFHLSVFVNLPPFEYLPIVVLMGPTSHIILGPSLTLNGVNHCLCPSACFLINIRPMPLITQVSPVAV